MQMSMNQTCLVSRVQAERSLRDKAEPDSRHGGQRRPIGTGQTRQPLLQDSRPSTDLQHFHGRSHMRMSNGRSLCKLPAKFIGMAWMGQLRIRKMSQDRLMAVPRIE